MGEYEYNTKITGGKMTKRNLTLYFLQKGDSLNLSYYQDGYLKKIFTQILSCVTLSLLLSFLFISPISAQIIIKEKIEIDSLTVFESIPKLSKAENQVHSLRAVHHWQQTYLGDENDIPMSRMRFRFSADNCDKVIYSDFDYSGNLDFIINDILGTSYSIALLLSTRTLWDPEYQNEHEHGAPFQVYVDNEEVSPTGEFWFGTFGIMSDNDEISYNSFGNEILYYTHESCDPIIGRMNKDFPIISIIQGEEYLSFYDTVEDDTIGNSFNAENYVRNGNMPLLIYDKPYFKDSPLQGIISAQINGHLAYDSIFINTLNEFDLIVRTTPRIINEGELSLIHISHVTIDEDTITFPPTQLFDVEIIEGAQLGTIISANGIDSSDSFEGIEEGFSFLANERIIPDTSEILIRVSTIVFDGFHQNKDDPPNILSNFGKPTSEKKMELAGDTNFISPNGPENSIGIIIPPFGSREIFGIGRLKIIGEDSLDHFELTILPDTLAEKDTLAFTESAKIYVQAKDKDSNNIELDNSSLLSFEIVSNELYGTFIDEKGDTNHDILPLLKDVSYEDAKMGKIKFAAIRENPDSAISCRLKVTFQRDTSLFGLKDAIVVEQTIKILLANEAFVEPIITGRRFDFLNDTYKENIDESNLLGFKVLHTRNRKRIYHHPIILKSDYLNGSGGHDHVDPRRPDTSFTFEANGISYEIPTERIRSQNYGSFYSFKSGEEFSADSMKGMVFVRSKMDTVSRFLFISSIWGDEMVIHANSVEKGELLKDSIIITERVPKLKLLSEHDDYLLVGGTQDHHGPPSFESDNNHYGTPVLVNALKKIAANYQKYFPGTRIRINDMSLKNGGKFDINGKWNGSHSQHRIGKNADISALGMNKHNRLIELDIRRMREIITDNTELAPLFHNPPHFHIYSK